MVNPLGVDDFPDSVARHFPADVRDALTRRARSGAALRLYRRRGWNPSAVRFQYDRATADLQAALDRWEHAENNPTLF